MKYSPISVQDKKAFIDRFLKHYHLQNRESVWILNYLSNHDDILSRSHFVRSVTHCPRGMIISSRCAKLEENISFRFHKQQLITDDPEKTFHEIRLNRKQKLYIQLNFYKSYQCPYYASVLEENPFEQTDNLTKQQQDQEITNQLLDHLLFEQQKKRLEKAIDLSLDRLDYASFKRLSTELQQLMDRDSDLKS